MASIRTISERLYIKSFPSFRSMFEYRDKVSEETGFDYTFSSYGASKGSIIDMADWFGYDKNSPLSLEEQFGIDNLLKFLEPEMLDRSVREFEDLVANIDFGGNLEASRLRTSSIPQGVFNFGLASKGLYRPVEYYSEHLKKVVADGDVMEEVIKGQKFYYTIHNNKQYKLRVQQEGTFLVEKNCNADGKVQVKYDERARMYVPFRDGQIYNGCGKFDYEYNEESRLKYRTTTKKVYMYRDKQGGGLQPYVDLFINVSAQSSFETEQMLIKALPVLVIAQFLTKAGIKTRIYGTRGFYQDDNGLKYLFFPWVIKDYNESLNLNELASVTADKRMFRVQLFNLIPPIMKKEFGLDVNGFGYTLYGRRSPDYADDLIPLFNLSRNFLLNKRDQITSGSKVTDARLMILGGVGSIDTSDKLDSTFTKEKIEDEIYRLGDYISILFSKNPNNTIKKIEQREKERAFKKGIPDPRKYIRDYLTQTIIDNLVVVDEEMVSNPIYTTPANLREDILAQKQSALEALKAV